MSSLTSLVRNTVARFGYALERLDPHAPPTLAAFLRSLPAGDSALLGAVGFDNDASIQAELLRVLHPELVVFFSPTAAPDSLRPAEPAGRFIAAVDLRRGSPESLLTEFPWLGRAEAWLLRAPLGAFWSGELDLTIVVAGLRRVGLDLHDVLQLAPRSAFQAPASGVILVATKGGAAATRRVPEALSFLSAPITDYRDFQVLAGRGSFGFAAGLYNPGALVADGTTHLLVRAETAPWAVQKTSETRYFSSASPLLLRIDAAHRITVAAPLPLVDAPDPAGYRAEDFRLFQFRGEVYSNHAVISREDGGAGREQPLQVELLRTRVGVSRLDLATPAFTWCGFPSVDRPLERTEKNWAMFADNTRLLLLYSFAPYVLLAAENWPGLKFTTVLESLCPMPVGDPALAFRNSVNPVPYDDEHWLHVVHQVYPGKQYVFWAVLLSRRTLRPLRASARPLVRAWHGCAASIVYVSSAVVDSTEVKLFAGLDDSTTAVVAVPRRRLDAEWVELPAAADGPA